MVLSRNAWISTFASAAVAWLAGCSLDSEGGLDTTAGAAGSGNTAATAASGGSGGGSSAAGGTGGSAPGGSGGSGAGSGAAGSSGGTGAVGGSGASGGAGGGTGGMGATGASGGTGATGGTGGTVTIPSCSELYTTVTGVKQVCSSAPGRCKLDVSTDPNDNGGQPCSEICKAGGGECQEVFDDNGTCQHDPGDKRDCGDATMGSAICFCSHGCGGNPPCPQTLTCVSGQCV